LQTNLNAIYNYYQFMNLNNALNKQKNAEVHKLIGPGLLNNPIK